MTTEQWTRDHDARLARALGFVRDEEGHWTHTDRRTGLPHFDSDLNSTFKAQADIERRGLWPQYCLHLATDSISTTAYDPTTDGLMSVEAIGYRDAWTFVNATAEQRAWALLKTLETTTADDAQN